MRLFIAFLVIALVLVAGAVGALWYGHQLYTRVGPLQEPKLVLIPRGIGASRISAILKSEGVIEQPLIFRIVARIQAPRNSLKAGEYEFVPGMNLAGVMAKIYSGDTYARKVTIAEGLTVAQAVSLLNEAEGMTGRITAVPEEGSLLPETYHYHRGDDRARVLQRMAEAMRETLSALWERRAGGLPLNSPEEALILASIVEKETGVAGERGAVASVFINRLRKGMRLQSDPTVVYAATGGSGPLGRAIRRSDLERDSPYNTYERAGLPPTPIAIPGRNSIAAVLNPPSTDYLYFVADGTGGHVFAKSLAEHNANVRKWRRIQRQRGQR